MDMVSGSNFTRENLYCLIAIAFFIWRAQFDIRDLTATPLTVSESYNVGLVACLTSIGGSVDIHRIGVYMAVCFQSFLSLIQPDP